MSAHRRGRHRRHGLDALLHLILVNLRELVYLLTARPTVTTATGLFTLFFLI